MTLAARPYEPVVISPEAASDAVAVDALVLAAFGPGRFAKTAERLRERARCVAGFVSRDDDTVVGSVRLWAVTVGGTFGVFLGPIAVQATQRSGGLGGALVEACIAAAREMGVGGVLLVGDVAYFERFGFRPAPEARLPGPVDRRRVMWLPITADVAAGDVHPA